MVSAVRLPVKRLVKGRIINTKGTTIHLLGLAGIMARGPTAEYAQMVGFLVEFVLLSIALADRINRERLARENVQREAIELNRKISRARKARLTAQEELLAVQHRANEELEKKVRERTETLHNTMQRLEAANDELSRLSFLDPLTKVYNRRYFDQTISAEIKRASRNDQPLAVAILDIDHFKQVNDTFGHLTGDQCLRRVAGVLKQQLEREGDVLARYGGEEFAFILPATSKSSAVFVANRARLAVEAIDVDHAGTPIPLTISVGVAAWIPEIGESPKRLIEAADDALYLAKAAGRNQVMAGVG